MNRVSVGDIAPPFALPNQAGDAFDLYGDDVAGNFISILFCPGGTAAAIEQLKGFAEVHDALRQQGVRVIAVSDEPVTALAKCHDEYSLPFDLLSDAERRLLTGYGIPSADSQADSQPVTYLIRPNLHCLQVVHDGLHAETTLRLVHEQQEQQIDSTLGFQPPILMVPDVFTHDDCERLIAIYNAPGVPMIKSSELMNLQEGADVKTRVADYDRQDRIDHFIMTDESKRFVSSRLGRRLLPEIKKAFNYQVAEFEGLRIARYKGQRGGRAHGHRDNSLPEVAHRRFALSINLNAEDFEGGEIRFPEYGNRRYKAQTGAALVFSCSLLHEALAVTQGQRLVLLAFLNGDS